MNRTKQSAFLMLAVLVLGLSVSPSSRADDPPIFPAGTFITLTNTNVLERFNVAEPGVRLASNNVTGLAPGDSLIGIDFRPATGQLYGLGVSSRLYRVDPLTGVGTAVGGVFDPLLGGSAGGFDFDPVTDQIRIVLDPGQNLRVNPDTGQVVSVDTPINPAAAIVGSAYTNNFTGAATTTLYGLNLTTDQLVLQNPPNNGTVTPIGSLGVDFEFNTGFDIVGTTNTAYAVFFTGSLPSKLYTINLTTGVATLVGAIGGGGSAVRGLAVVTGPDNVFGVTTSNKLLNFRGYAPGTILGTSPITGLQPGENVLGIDFRPATGELYGLGSTSRIYRIDTFTAAAAAVGGGPFAPVLSGSDFGFDFNPQSDRIRIVSDAEQNVRAHPDLGTISNVDTGLTPAGNVVAAAYTSNFAGAVSTSLFDIDSVTDLLLLQSPPNNGVLAAVGPLGVDASGQTGLDFTAAGNALASITLQGAATTGYYRLGAAGAATLIGTIGGGETIRDTAIRLGTETAYAVTQSAGPVSRLIRFHPATPGTIISTVVISGLQAGESLLGIDSRPATGQLFALGSTSRLYTLDRTTAVATQVGAGAFTPALSGSAFGFDFNPTVDRIRVVSNTEQNLRIDPNTGLVQNTDTLLNPAGNIVAAAYSNNVTGVSATQLFDVDAVTDQLFVQNPPNNGVLNLVGSLGVDIGLTAGFDIAPLSGIPYLAAYLPAAVNPTLFRVDVDTGAATSVGVINTAETLVGFTVAIDRDPKLFSSGFE